MGIRTIFFLIILYLSNNQNSFAFSSEMEEIYLVKSIKIEGNKVTNTSIIKREVVFKEGDYVSDQKLDEKVSLTKSNLINTNLFLDINILYLVDSLNNIDISIVVKERWYWSIFPHLTLADRSFNEWWYERDRDLDRITYGIDIMHYNFTGNADQLSSKIHLGFQPSIQFSYSKPYLDKKKRIGLAAGIYYTSQKSLAYRTWRDKIEFVQSNKKNFSQIGLSLDLRYRKAYNYFHNFSLGLSQTNISDSIVIANPEYFGNKSTSQFLVRLGYEFRMDFRDVRQYALKGNLFMGSISQYVANGGKSQTTVSARYNQYMQLSDRLFYDIGLRAKASFPREQSYFLGSGLGYGGNVARGYELYVIDGQYFLLNKNTIKYLAYQNKLNFSWLTKRKEFSTVPIAVYPNVFLDYGFVRNFYPERSNSFLSNDHILGAGFGLDVVTFYNVNIRAYYTFNHLNERKFFFALTREF